MTKKLIMVAACVAAVCSTSGVAYADDQDTSAADVPVAGSPLCNVMGGDDGTKWELAPCGWAYGDEKGWYRVP